mgnify:CR=1 FL=1
MKEYLRAVCLCMATLVAVLFATGVVWYGYLVAAALFGLTRGETAQKEAIDKAIQLWEALMAKQQYEMPAAEWRRLRPFYTLTVEALKNERDRAARRGGVKETRENSEGA